MRETTEAELRVLTASVLEKFVLDMDKILARYETLLVEARRERDEANRKLGEALTALSLEQQKHCDHLTTILKAME